MPDKAGRYHEITFAGGQLAPGMSVTVRLPGTTNAATLYTNRDKAAAAANPVTVDAQGNLAFYADPGYYDLFANGATISNVLVPPDYAVVELTGDQVVRGPKRFRAVAADTFPLIVENPAGGKIFGVYSTDVGAGLLQLHDSAGTAKISLFGQGGRAEFGGGVDVSGSPSGYTAEVRLTGGAGGEYGLSTNATGSPVWDFDHRGAGNTGSWVWRNGTGAGAARLRLLAGGDLEFPTGTLRFLAVHVRTTAATAGTSGAPPAQVAGYITTRMDGTDIKLPYYNP